jgi:hypothetical protein
MDACLRVWEQGMDLPAGIGVPTKGQIERACREVMAGVDTADLKPRVVRGFLVRIVRSDNAPAETSGQRNTARSVGDDTRDSALRAALRVQAMAGKEVP